MDTVQLWKGNETCNWCKKREENDILKHSCGTLYLFVVVWTWTSHALMCDL